MNDVDDNEDSSPFDHLSAGPIEGRVVDWRSKPRIHGFSIHDDLAAHYGLADVLFLTLTGELPSNDSVRQAFELTLIFASTVDIADASVHAARLARHVMSGKENPAASAAVGGIGAAEQIQSLLSGAAPAIDWLQEGGSFPSTMRAQCDEERSQVRSFSELLSPQFRHPIFDEDPALGAVLVTTLHRCGLERIEQQMGALLAVRMPVVMAEAYAVTDSRIWNYPLNLPHWVYTQGSDD